MRPGYLPPEHYDQVFSAHGTIMIFFAAMPLMIGLMNFVVPLQLGVRDVAFPTLNSTSFWLTATGALLVNISLVVGEFARTGWLPYPPLSEIALFARRRRRLLSVGAADFRRRHVDDRHQFRHHHPENPRARHELSADADLLLDRARFQSPDHRRISGAYRDARHAAARPLCRLSFLHQRGRRQHDDVHQPDLGVGPSGSLYSRPAGVRRVLRGDLHILRQAAVRLPLDGGGDVVHLSDVVHRLAAPFLHHGRRRRRQRLLRHRHQHHRRRHRREDLQLDVHDVWRPHPLHDADAVVARLYRHLHHRRHDRRAPCRAAGRLPAAQQPVPGGAFPQRHHCRRGVRRLCRDDVLVSEGVRFPAARGLGQSGVLAQRLPPST